MNTGLADILIKKPKGIRDQVSSSYYTEDIVGEILKADQSNDWEAVAEFAKYIPFQSVYNYAYRIWNFVRTNIRYVEDPDNVQLIKSPAATWQDKYADCKSMSLFIGALLKTRGIDYKYRFTSYTQLPVWTHVYIVVPFGEKEIIIDTVLSRFNYQKPYKFKKDYLMKGLYRVSGVNSDLGIDILNPHEADLEAGIMRQRLEIERDLMGRLGHIGTAKQRNIDKGMEVLDRFVDAMKRSDDHTMRKILGDAKGPGKMWLTRLYKLHNEKRIGNVGNTLLKVVSAPQRLLAKGILEVALPQIAPFFLYLFINDQNILNKCPQKVRTKRAKQVKLADFIVNTIGMKRDHFMGIVRNGIMKKMKKSPETLLAEMMKGKITGIGAVAAILSLIPVIVKLIGQLATVFKKKADFSISNDDAYDPTDFGAALNPGVSPQAAAATAQKAVQTAANIVQKAKAAAQNVVQKAQQKAATAPQGEKQNIVQKAQQAAKNTVQKAAQTAKNVVQKAQQAVVTPPPQDVQDLASDVMKQGANLQVDDLAASGGGKRGGLC